MTQDPIPFYELDQPDIGNRFDSALGGFSVLYFGSKRECCFGETLARFRLDPDLFPLIAEEWRERGFMDPGALPAEWRNNRQIVRARVTEELPFLDVEALDTREHLRHELGELLAYLHYKEIDVSIIRGGDRRVTRWISQWAYDQTDDEDNPIYNGIRYLSRLNSDWECWAVFDDAELVEIAAYTIDVDDRDLKRVADAYGIQVH